MSSMYPSSGGTMARPCRNCGTPLAVNESQCLQCGASNVPPLGSQFPAFQPGGQGQGTTRTGLLSGMQQPSQPSQPLSFRQADGGGWSGSGAPETVAPWGAVNNSQPQNNLWPGQVPATDPGQSQSLQKNLFAPQIDFSEQNQMAGPGPARPPQSGPFTPQVDFGGTGMGQLGGPPPSQPLQQGLFSSALNPGGQNQMGGPGSQAGLFTPQVDFGGTGTGQLGGPSPSQPLQQGLFSAPMNPGGQNQMGGPGSANGFGPGSSQFSANTFVNMPPQNSFGSPSQALNLNNPSAAAYGQNDPSGWHDSPDNWGGEEHGKKRPGVGVIILIIVLLVAIVGGSFGAFLLFKPHGTPVAKVSTPVPIVTPAGKAQFQETFANNNAGWDLSQPPGAKITLSGGQLLLESDDNKIFQEQLPSKNFADFRVDVNAGLVTGDPANGYGIYIRGATGQDGTLSLYYCFEVYGDGTFAVYKGTQGSDGTNQRTDIKKDTSSSAINPKGQVNHLTVIANGTQMSFIVNGITIFKFSDSSYKSGAVALFVSNVSGVAAGASATFKSLAIFDPDEK